MSDPIRLPWLSAAGAASLICASLLAQAAPRDVPTLRFGQAVQTRAISEANVVVPLARQVAWRSGGALRMHSVPAYQDGYEAVAALERGELDLAFIRLDDVPAHFPHHWVVSELGRLGDSSVSGRLHQALVDRGMLCGYGRYQVLAAATLPAPPGEDAPGVVLIMNADRYDALAEPLKDVLDSFDRGWLPDRLSAIGPSFAGSRPSDGGIESAHPRWQPMQARHPGGQMIDRVIAETLPRLQDTH
ncbi:MAG: hypothetical protein R3E83_05520 [Burkholderiaceae bacterium]